MTSVFQNPVATAFEIFWMIFEPILFGLTGTQIKINELDRWAVSIGIACLLAGIIVSMEHCTLMICKVHSDLVKR
jgi:hypothetical protein